MPVSTRQLSSLIFAYNSSHEKGGNCQEVLEDYNIDDDSVKDCLEKCLKKSDIKGFNLMKALLEIKEGMRERVIQMSLSY